MRRLILTCFAASFTLCAPAHAERLFLHYEGKAWGIASLGEAALDISLLPDSYRVGATLQSGGMMKLFDNSDLVAQAKGAVNQAGPVWTSYDLDHNYAKKRRVTNMRAQGGAVNVDVTPIYRNLGNPAATEEQKRTARDPLSSIMAMSMEVARTHKCEGAYSTFDGRFLYVLEFAGGKEGHFETDGYDGRVLKCVVHYIPVAGYEPRNAKESRKKTPKAELWFALDSEENFAPLVRMVLPLGLGKATLSLTEMRRPDVQVIDDPLPATTN